MNNKTNRQSSLGEYFRDVFDLNKDGKVTVKEFLHTLVPSQAVGIALIVVDLLALVGEYRVWQVGLVLSQGDAYKALGYVAVSLLPFYLSQVLWLYPNASGWQQFLAVLMGLMALFTSVQFGLADLTMQYDVVFISKMVVYLWLAYIVILLLYVVNDKNFKLMRMRTNARANARFQNEMNETMSDILANLESSLERERQLRARFGDDAVEAHLSILRDAKKGGRDKNHNNNRLPEPEIQEPPANP